jgi:NAD(P)-dependent dehydrogenase (short-subunit alcohol dehydrogenase family)
MQIHSLEGQTAIVTGAADGLGFALAQNLIRQGVTTALFDIRADKLAEARQKLGPLSQPYCLDITDSEAVQAAVNQLLEARTSVQILVNCAGITGKTNVQSHAVSLEDYDRVMAVNARGSLITSQAVLPGMLAQGYGRIVHVASIAGKEGNAGMTAYSMSKAAVIALTKVQGKEYAETGVTVNAIAPAVIRTEMVAAMPAAQVQYMTDKIPMKRCGTLEEFAHLAAFVVSPQASFTTGFTFDLTGGRATY